MVIREVKIQEVLFGDIEVSAVRKPGAGYLYNRITKQQRTTVGEWVITPPAWATYAYIAMYGGGGGGGAGSGAIATRGSGGFGGKLYTAGYFLDGSLSGEVLRFNIGAGGTGGNSENARGNEGSNTTLTLGTYYRVATGGLGGVGGNAGGGADGETVDYDPTGADGLRFDKEHLRWPAGVGGSYGTGRGGTSGSNGGHGGGAGAGGIFGRWHQGGNGGNGIARVVFWGMDPYVDPNENPYMN